MKLLKKIDKIIDTLLVTICIFFLVLLFTLLVLNVFFRFVPLYSMGWFDEIVELSFTSLTFFGAAYLWRHREHSRLDFLQEKFHNTKKEFILELIVNIVGLIFVIFFLKYSIILISKTTAWSPIFKIPRKVFYMSMPISGIFMGVYTLRDIADYIMKLIGKDLSLEKTI